MVPGGFSGARELSAVIERAAHDPAFDVEKLQRLLDLYETQTMRAAEKEFNAALVGAQSAMLPIQANANNPQTRSRYATFAALDREARPIYTKFGLAPSFNTEPTGDPNTMRVVGMLAHVAGYSRRYQIDMAVDTKGARGGDVMTRTHATGSAFSYGKRYLLAGMFNLIIDHDDDGNAAGGGIPYRQRANAPEPRSAPPRDMNEPVDSLPVEQVAPYTIEPEGGTWGDFVEPLTRHILHSQSIEEFDQWRLKNQDMLLKLKETKPQLFRLFERNIEGKHQELLAQ
ncbi:ERF family protein [Bradyrhizobium neotropicale]|uniref:ERF family protein n=1 Tax=Bradyrhizobium neotropicale TaxID=1497615 RepID=UPI001AD67916|nr:ERF family protein [Bradyrhizobium neotropicale]